MDLFLVVVDVIVITLYIILIALISPFIMRVVKKWDYDLFFQLIPILSIIFMSSITICVSYGGFKETLFFQITTIVSLILLLTLLFLTLMMKNLWKLNYDKLLTWYPSFRKNRLNHLKAK